MGEPVPLAEIQTTVLEFLRDRDDVAVFGAQAVDVHVDEARMTQEVDLLSPRAAEIAEELRALLADRFKIAMRVRQVAGGRGFRVFQMRKPKAGTDWRDLAMLLLAFPELKSATGPVRERLDATGVDAGVLATWEEFVALGITAEEGDDEFQPGRSRFVILL